MKGLFIYVKTKSDKTSGKIGSNLSDTASYSMQRNVRPNTAIWP